MIKQKERKIVWTTKKVGEASQKIRDGYILPNHEIPFFEKTPGLRKKGVSFGFTGNELDEYTKCKVDVTYFANNYCFIKVEDGSYKLMNIRDYQYDILDLYKDNKYSILMASRQVGKCSIFLTKIMLKNKISGKVKETSMYKLLFKLKINKSIYDYLKFSIYWMLDKIDG